MSGNNGQSSNGKPTGKQRDSSPADRLKPYQWKPGESGNPSGLPKGTVRITDRLRKIVEQDDGKVANALATAAVKAAAKGDYRFFKEILDRLDGPVKQHLEAVLTQLVMNVEEAEKPE